MARRIINKAYNDLMGGAGADSVSLGPELPRNSSVMRLSSKDVSYGNRRAVEIKPIDDNRKMPKGPLQMAHALRRDSVKPNETAERSHFVNIDGDGYVKQVDTQQFKAVPQTAYKMRSFMSTVELGPRGARPPTQMPQSVKPPPPPPRADAPKMTQPEGAKMFLPKGIHRSDQPYVVPKFMPPYREMMTPKPKPDPLVSIVEKTPPSLQKWAVEWNTEPNKTISIDELKEDLIREAAEKPPKMPGRSQRLDFVHESNAKGIAEEQEPKQPNTNNVTTVPVEDTTRPSAPESRTSLPWKDLQVPTSSETDGVQRHQNPAQRQQEIGRPLVDWVPPKYNGSNRPYDPRRIEYSFQEAIKNGTPLTPSKRGPKEPKPFFDKQSENGVRFDTDELKFHEWFKTKMSAAVHSVANSRVGGQSKDNQAHTHANKLYPNDEVVPTAELFGGNDNNQAENPNSNIIQRDSSKDSNGATAPQGRDRHESATRAYAVPENNSSFYHWLKQRGQLSVKNEPNPPEIKQDKEKPVQNPHPSQYPWSVSYTLRGRASTPALSSQKVASKNLKQTPKTASQNRRRPGSPKSPKTSGKACSENNMTKSKLWVKRLRTPLKSRGRNPAKFFAVNKEESSGRQPARNVGKGPAQNHNREIRKMEKPKALTPTDFLWFNDGWKVDSEKDHVNNMRKMEMTSKTSQPLGGPQMKYWESKYINAKPNDRKCVPAEDNGDEPHPKWIRLDKASDGVNATKGPQATKHVGKHDANDFSSIAEYSRFPLKLSRDTKDDIINISDDFDVDGFLNKEEAVEKELLTSTERRENKKKEDQKTMQRPANFEHSERSTGKVKGKEHIKFPRSVKARVEPKNDESAAPNLKQRMEDEPNDDEFVLALGEDPGLEDVEWSEFIGPKNVLEHDTDLTRLLGGQARQLSSLRDSCL